MAEKKYYLIQVRNARSLSPEYPLDTEYYIQDYPGTTNQAGEVKTEGWLGTTDDVAKYACGEFVSIEAAAAAIPGEFVPTDKGSTKYVSKQQYVRLHKRETTRRPL